MATVDFYSKVQTDDLLDDKMDAVDTTGASEGDVLTLDSNLEPMWSDIGNNTIRDLTGLSVQLTSSSYLYTYYVSANLIRIRDNIAIRNNIKTYDTHFTTASNTLSSSSGPVSISGDNTYYIPWNTNYENAIKSILTDVLNSGEILIFILAQENNWGYISNTYFIPTLYMYNKDTDTLSVYYGAPLSPQASVAGFVSNGSSNYRIVPIKIINNS